MVPSSEDVLPEGFVLGSYEIIRCIGTGGMGIVYKALHQGLNKPVAIKVLRRDAASDAESRERFLREGTTASLLRHPHVVDVTDVGQAGNHAFLVMELLEGESFSALLRREGRLSAHRIADILVPVAAALAEAHALGVVHRDLKPDNIYLSQGATGRLHPKVLDFGISKVLDTRAAKSLTGDNLFVGTPMYASPEHLQASTSLSGDSDQYSLGVVLYEAAVGRNPFEECDSLVSILSAIANARFPTPAEAGVEVDSRLEAIFLKAMACAPADRFDSMFALGARLLEFASEETRANWTRYFAEGEPIQSSPPRKATDVHVSHRTTVAESVPVDELPTRVERVQDGLENRRTWLVPSVLLAGLGLLGVLLYFRVEAEEPVQSAGRQGRQPDGGLATQTGQVEQITAGADVRAEESVSAVQRPPADLPPRAASVEPPTSAGQVRASAPESTPQKPARPAAPTPKAQSNVGKRVARRNLDPVRTEKPAAAADPADRSAPPVPANEPFRTDNIDPWR